MKDPQTGRRTMGKQGFAALLALLAVAASAAIAELAGPIPVYVGSQASNLVAPTWYLASAGIPFGVLMAEAVIDFREYKWLPRRLIPVAMLLLLGLLGSVRLGLRAPVSGHALVVTYYLLHQLAERRAGRSWKLLLGCLVLIQTALYKLLFWHDAATFLMGIGMGLLAWGVERTVLLVWVVRAEKDR